MPITDHNLRDESPKLKKTSVALVVILTIVTNGIYLPLWFLARRKQFNGLHAEEKIEDGIYIGAIICFSFVTLLSFYSDFAGGMNLLGWSGHVGMIDYLELFADIASLIIVVPLVQQTFKVKRMLSEHYNDYLKKDIRFSNILTMLFLNIYLQYKINRLEQ